MIERANQRRIQKALVILIEVSVLWPYVQCECVTVTR